MMELARKNVRQRLSKGPKGNHERTHAIERAKGYLVRGLKIEGCVRLKVNGCGESFVSICNSLIRLALVDIDA